MNIEKELKLAKKYKKQNNINGAREIYVKILEKYPNSDIAKQGLKSITTNKKTDSSNGSLSMEEQNNLVSLYQNNRINDAMRETSNFIKLYPNHPFLYNFLGLCFQKISQDQNAINSFIRALEIKPDYIEAYYNLGNHLKALGRKEDAILAYEEALKIDSSNSTIIRELGSIKDFSKDSDGIKNIFALYKQTKDTNELIELGYLLFKILNDNKEYSSAFRYLEKSNHLKFKTSNYNVDDHISYIHRVKDMFETVQLDLLKADTKSSNSDTIFIVGMPRSGTTLTEQILASHSNVTALGEQNFMTSIINKYISKDNKELSKDDIDSIKEDYIKEQSHLGNFNTKYLTDKTPHNFIYIGFILLAFPNAKVINLSRDPIANGWSLYKTYFPADGLGYSYDFDDIVEFYKTYTNMIEFWNKLFPGKIYNLKYESLVTDLENSTRDLLKYCDLDFEESCLEYYKSERSVSTASSQQVRRSIYNDSLTEWKKYSEQLNPLVELLAEYELIDDH